MLILKFVDLENEYLVEFNQSGHVVTISSEESLPEDTSGFFLSREDKSDRWDYTAFTTIYRVISKNVIQFSDDGSKYVPPTKDYTVSAIWNDGNDVYGIRPEEVECIVWLEGKKQGRDVLNAGNNWKKSHHNKPAENQYYITAPDLDRYEKSISGTTVTYSVYVPQPRQVSDDDMAQALMDMYEQSEPDSLANIYAAYCENNRKNFNDVPEAMKTIVNAVIDSDGFMVNEDGTVSVKPINAEV